MEDEKLRLIAMMITQGAGAYGRIRMEPDTVALYQRELAPYDLDLVDDGLREAMNESQDFFPTPAKILAKVKAIKREAYDKRPSEPLATGLPEWASTEDAERLEKTFGALLERAREIRIQNGVRFIQEDSKSLRGRKWGNADGPRWTASLDLASFWLAMAERGVTYADLGINDPCTAPERSRINEEWIAATAGRGRR